MNNTVQLSEEQVIQYIYDVDFNPIIGKLVHQMGWSKAHADEVCTMYRRFLILQKKYGQWYFLPPSEDIDEFWHMHILDTKNYRLDCERIFGRYLDHNPEFEIDDKTNIENLEQAFTKTFELYKAEFGGQDISEVRGTWAKIIAFLKCLLTSKPKRFQAT